VYPVCQHLSGAGFGYFREVPELPFTERFNAVTASISETELALVLDLSISAVRKLRSGETQTLKLDGALRLCSRLGIDPWYLAFGKERSATPNQPAFSMFSDDVSRRDRESIPLPQQEDQRLARVEAELREMREILKEIEPQLQQLVSAKARPPKVKKLA